MSKATYSRLRAYCETNGISMSQFVERRVGDFLGRAVPTAGPVATAASAAPKASAPTPAPRPQPAPTRLSAGPVPVRVVDAPARPRRIEPEGPRLKDPDQKLTAEQIFTF